MKPRSLTAFWAAALGALALCLIASGLFGRLKGIEGFTLGVSGSLFNLGALWAVIGLMTSLANAPKPERRGTKIVVLAFLIKLPLFFALAAVAHRIGGAALGCFLVGVALVYLALVGWTLARG